MSLPRLEIVAAASARRLTTLAALKADLGLAGSAYDGALELIIDEASETIAHEIGVLMGDDGTITLARESLREVWRLGNSTDTLYTGRSPIVPGTLFVWEGGRALAEGTDFEVLAAAGAIRRLGGAGLVSWLKTEIRADYDGGWIVPDGADETAIPPLRRNLPATIEYACRVMCQYMWTEGQRAQRRELGLKSITIPDVVSRTFRDETAEEALHKRLERFLAPYRRPVMG